MTTVLVDFPHLTWEKTFDPATNVDLVVVQQLFQKYGVKVLENNFNLLEFIRRKIADDGIEEGPFFVMNLKRLYTQFIQWKRWMPRVEPFYAVKCNPDLAMLEALAALGVGFDCASMDEINRVVSVGVTPDRIILANPCKQASHIRGAKQASVSRMTFDNAAELEKIKRFYPDAELVLRLLPDESQSVMKFGAKFGAPFETCAELLRLAGDLGLSVVGVSFHVGSGCVGAECFVNSLKMVRNVFDIAKELGHTMTLVDIGGGFPGDPNSSTLFKQLAETITNSIDQLFPNDVRIIAEPGRYFAASAYSLVVNVYAKKNCDTRHPVYYINDGVYGSFNCIIFDHAKPQPILVAPRSGEVNPSDFFGPTCDSIDLVCQNVPLPPVEVGDWVVFDNMGAYTSAAASTFNGFSNQTMFHIFG